MVGTCSFGLTDFVGRKWTPELVERHKDRIDWFSLSHNEQLFDWSMDQLEKYESYIDFSSLNLNRNAWYSAFGDLTQSDVEKLLEDKEIQEGAAKVIQEIGNWPPLTEIEESMMNIPS